MNDCTVLVLSCTVLPLESGEVQYGTIQYGTVGYQECRAVVQQSVLFVAVWPTRLFAEVVILLTRYDNLHLLLILEPPSYYSCSILSQQQQQHTSKRLSVAPSPPAVEQTNYKDVLFFSPS